ncbi:MAG: potassium transporter [Bacteroidales bacterium]|nr:potassium transporter [Bacteroidales bacterium]
MIPQLFDILGQRGLYNRHISPITRVAITVATATMHLSAFCVIACLVLRFGFNLDDNQLQYINYFESSAPFFFALNFLLHLHFSLSTFRKDYTRLGILLNVTLLLLILAPVVASMPWLRYAQMALVGFMSLLDLSALLIGALNKRVSPSIVIGISFIILILVGSGLLMLPRCLANTHLHWIDSLFVSTSAVCVTGLSTIDITTTFTPMGQFVLMLLFQVGGLGVMTFTSFFALFLTNNSSISSQVVMRDMVSGKSISSLMNTLLSIIGFTIVIEGVGAVLIWLSARDVIADQDILHQVFFCVFHSISAFCNAGFSNYPDGLGNTSLMNDSHLGLYWVMSFVIILGAIGYPLLLNLRDMMQYHINVLLRRKNRTSIRHRFHLLNVNSKLVLVTTVLLLVLGTVFFAMLEWNNAFAGMTWQEKLTQAFFNSTSPRTAGFSSVPLSGLCLQSMALYMLLMWIGGAAQSTAGGIKVNVFAAAAINVWNALRGKRRVDIFHREINGESISQANATIFISVAVFAVAFLILTRLQPTLSARAIAFECVSAMSTVGSSLGITAQLCDSSKLIICALMLLGRIGMLSFFMNFIPHYKNPHYSNPKDELIIS